MRKSLPVFVLGLLLLTLTNAVYAADAAPAASPAGVVNINTADASQLELLPRIGEKGAQRIIEYRTQHGPFKKTSDLMQVKGVGAKTFELLSPYIAVEGKTTLTTKISGPRRARKTAAKQ
jgi:competence protein ComEA